MKDTKLAHDDILSVEPKIKKQADVDHTVVSIGGSTRASAGCGTNQSRANVLPRPRRKPWRQARRVANKDTPVIDATVPARHDTSGAPRRKPRHAGVAKIWKT